MRILKQQFVALIRTRNEKGNRRRKKEKGGILQIKKDEEVNGHYEKCG
jgi:hypothetical protein